MVRLLVRQLVLKVVLQILRSIKTNTVAVRGGMGGYIPFGSVIVCSPCECGNNAEATAVGCLTEVLMPKGRDGLAPEIGVENRKGKSVKSPSLVKVIPLITLYPCEIKLDASSVTGSHVSTVFASVVRMSGTFATSYEVNIAFGDVNGPSLCPVLRAVMIPFGGEDRPYRKYTERAGPLTRCETPI